MLLAETFENTTDVKKAGHDPEQALMSFKLHMFDPI